MEAYAGIDVACAKGKRLPIVICTRGSDGLHLLPLSESVHRPPQAEGNAQAIQLFSIPYTREQWLSLFPDGTRRLITASELGQVAGRE